MGMRIGLVILFVLGTSWACDSRELETNNIFTRETEISEDSVLQVNHPESEREIQSFKEVGKKENVCTLCEEFAAEALSYLAANKTQTETIYILHKSCSKMGSFEQKCLTLVDYYAPLFFLEISSIQPRDFCQKVNLCKQVVFITQRLSNASCAFCQLTVAEILLKLKDPDTKSEIIEMLLKGCVAVKGYEKKCKTMVSEYGPLILANAEQLLESNDICTMLHACNLPKASTKQAFTGETSVIATS